MTRNRSFGPPTSLICAALLLAGCGNATPLALSSPSAVASSPPLESPSPVAAIPSLPPSNIGPAPVGSGSQAGPRCGSPTDHVYHPYRLRLIDPCKTVSGTIVQIRYEADGDYHVLLALDPQYASLLQPANTTGEHGDLVLEPICQITATQADAVVPCQGYVAQVPIPPIGTHVIATGAYVYDLDHGGWAELHPLFELHPG